MRQQHVYVRTNTRNVHHQQQQQYLPVCLCIAHRCCCFLLAAVEQLLLYMPGTLRYTSSGGHLTSYCDGAAAVGPVHNCRVGTAVYRNSRMSGLPQLRFRAPHLFLQREKKMLQVSFSPKAGTPRIKIPLEDLPVDEVTVSVDEGTGKSGFIERDN